FRNRLKVEQMIGGISCMWNKNEHTQKLGIAYPIIQAGMAGGVTTPNLIAAVANAGGLRNLGAGYMQPEQMKQTIQKVKALTDQPFGVNVFIPEIPEVSEVDLEKVNEWLRPFREELKLKEPAVGKPSTAL